MTGLAEPPSELANIISAAVAETVNRSKDLGITWNLRLGTVNAISPISVIMDGDTVAVTAVSMVGQFIGVTQRVYILILPSGNFICGLVNPPQSPVYLGLMSSDNGFLAQSTGLEVAVNSVDWDSEPSMAFEPGYLFEVHLTTLFLDSTETDYFALRVRQGAASTTGTVLCQSQIQARGGTNGATVMLMSYFRNSTANRITTKLSLTVQRSSGTGSVAVFGNSGFPCILRVSRVGLISQIPGSTANTVTLT